MTAMKSTRRTRDLDIGLEDERLAEPQQHEGRG
jgi:hypothetical protein